MKVLGVCGGNGVILFPFKKYLVANYEIRSIFHTSGMEQWKVNFGDIPYYTKERQMYLQEGIDIIIGAPDCGHSSILAYSRAKKLRDPRDNKSLQMYIKSVLYYKPKVFLMENLPKLLQQYTIQDFKETFPDYELIFHNVSVREFGNSQKNRVRLVIIGYTKNLNEEDKANLQYQFSNIYRVSKLKTAGELTKGLKNENLLTGNIRESINDIITIYAGRKLSLSDIKNYWDRNPDKKRFVVTDRKFTTAPGVYRNLDNDFPATARKANRQYNQDGLQLTPRELARIQGVPDRFKLYIDTNRAQYWVNKTRATVTKTPPYEIGYWFHKQCKKIITIFNGNKDNSL